MNKKHMCQSCFINSAGEASPFFSLVVNNLNVFSGLFFFDSFLLEEQKKLIINMMLNVC